MCVTTHKTKRRKTSFAERKGGSVLYLQNTVNSIRPINRDSEFWANYLDVRLWKKECRSGAMKRTAESNRYDYCSVKKRKNNKLRKRRSTTRTTVVAVRKKKAGNLEMLVTANVLFWNYNAGLTIPNADVFRYYFRVYRTFCKHYTLLPKEFGFIFTLWE